MEPLHTCYFVGQTLTSTLSDAGCMRLPPETFFIFLTKWLTDEASAVATCDLHYFTRRWKIISITMCFAFKPNKQRTAGESVPRDLMNYLSLIFNHQAAETLENWSIWRMKTLYEKLMGCVTSWSPQLTDQTGLQNGSGFHLFLSSSHSHSPSSLPPPFFFLPPFFRESGRRKQEVAVLQEFGSVSDPASERGTTAPLVGDWNWCLSLPFPPFTQDHPLFRSSLISRSSLCSLPLGGAGKANRGIYQDHVQKSSLHLTELNFYSFFWSLFTNTVEYSFSSGWVFHSLVSPCKKKFLHAFISLSHADNSVSSDNMRLYRGVMTTTCTDLLVTFRRHCSGESGARGEDLSHPQKSQNVAFLFGIVGLIKLKISKQWVGEVLQTDPR